MRSQDFTGSTAVVVGGSRGLGRQVAAALHDRGASVVGISRGIQSDTPWRQEAVDATDADAMEEFFARRFRAGDDKSLLVNFAGSRYNASIAASDVSEWRNCFDSSLLSTYLALRGFVRAVGERRGAVVNMSSMHAHGAAAGRSAYGAAKAAVVQLTAIAATEFGPNIRVNCVEPGFIATQASLDMIAEGRLDAERIVAGTPEGRLGTEEDITRATLFLLSDDSEFITGETLRVDGGWLRHMSV